MLSWNVLHPEFTWYKIPSVDDQRKKLLQTPHPPRQTLWLPGWWRRNCARLLHKGLVNLSILYCKWCGISCPGQIWDLPFGLVLKYSDHTRLEEVLAMRTARAVGLPVPQVISYAEHPDTPWAPVSILMTRLPGEPLFQELWDWFLPEQKARLESPFSTRICSVAGTAIRSARVPYRYIGPCNDEEDFNRILIADAGTSFQRYEEYSKRAEKLIGVQHTIKFAHGDIAPHNLLVLEDGRISAFLDWEAAGWYPEYWDYSTATGFFGKKSWWHDIVDELPDGKYATEIDADTARWQLTIDTMFW